eukprot:3894937-Pleurochrysis_carterae.AAC.1
MGKGIWAERAQTGSGEEVSKEATEQEHESGKCFSSSQKMGKASGMRDEIKRNNRRQRNRWQANFL